MKTVHHRPSRRAERLNWSETALQRKPQKKALLVGIQYEADADGSDDEEANVLRGPHQDVMDMKTLLINYYGYAAEDIVVLVDRDDPNQIQPTRTNMLRAIENLVKDAQYGDRFFFHYAGHTLQVQNSHNSEEDGMDECIIPSDGEARLIKDNELRRLLVDALPIGSNLVAIFDSCHSASLLDLQHFRCNRVYVPWKSKGNRRTNSKWNANTRRLAMGEFIIHEVTQPAATAIPEVSTRHVYQNKRADANNVRSRRSTIDKLMFASKDYDTLSIRTRSLSIKSDLENWYEWPSTPTLRCTSPDAMWPCTGWCEPTSPKEANVVSLAACKDYQLSWESTDGGSMTKALIKILKADPHPTFQDLLTRVSHELHNLYLNLHSHAREYRSKLKNVNQRRAAKQLPPLLPPEKPEMNNFQDPQLSSHRPLNKDALWDP